MTQDATLSFACSIAREAGQLACELRKDGGQNFVSTKGTLDFVTQADRAVETLIREKLSEEFPGDTVLGEEQGGTLGRSTWIIDPIDGTTNFLKGLPEWGVCIAYAKNGELTHGVISCPDLGLMATASKGHGASLNGSSMPTRGANDVQLVQLGYSTRTDLSEHTAQIQRILAAGADYRRSGAACIGLLSVAAGWSDVYYERHLNLWDAAAGLVLLGEVGATCDHADLREFSKNGSALLAVGPSARCQMDVWKRRLSEDL